MKTAPKFAVWSEFTSYKNLFPRLEQLKKCDCALYLAVHASQFRQPELYELLNKANSLGLEVRPWLLLDESDGYWPNKWNLKVFSKFVTEFHHECVKHKVPLDWIILDLEPHIELMLEMELLLQKRKFLKARKLIRFWGNKLDWMSAQNEMQGLIDHIHSLGIKAHLVTIPMVLDDMKNNQNKLQHWLGLPVVGIKWDEISFMVYRPYFWDFFPKVSAKIVESYGKDAKSFFGDAASLALGPVGTPGMTQSKQHYKKPDELFNDIEAAQNSGIDRLSLFCLEGIEEQGRLEDFLKAGPQSLKSSFDWRQSLIRQAIKLGIKLL